MIVGASAGIGAELARELVRRGYFVALIARRGHLLEALTDELNAGGQMNARFYTHDVTDFDAVPLLFQTILADLHRIDSFIFNAGVMPKFEMNEF